MAFKVDLTDPFQAELDSVTGGFRTTAPFGRRRRRKRISSYPKDLLNAIMTIGGFNKGGLVSRNRKKKCKKF